MTFEKWKEALAQIEEDQYIKEYASKLVKETVDMLREGADTTYILQNSQSWQEFLRTKWEEEEDMHEEMLHERQIDDNYYTEREAA